MRLRQVLLVMSLATLSSCVASNFIQGQVNAHRIDQMSIELGVNVWKDAGQVELATAAIPTTSEIDMRNYAGVVAPAWSYGGVAVRVSGECGRDNLVHGYALQVRAHSKSGVYLQGSIDDVGDLPPGTTSERDPWLSFPLDGSVIEKMRQNGAVVRVRCEVGDWVFRLSPGYMLGFEAKLRSLRMLPTEPAR